MASTTEIRGSKKKHPGTNEEVLEIKNTGLK
jgi:hypothetical protein